jgi:hypothetical protein
MTLRCSDRPAFLQEYQTGSLAHHKTGMAGGTGSQRGADIEFGRSKPRVEARKTGCGPFVQELLPNMAGKPKIIERVGDGREYDSLLTPEQVAKRLNTSLDWVWDHSSRKMPLLPVIRFGDGPGRAGMLRYRASKIEEFIVEQERLTQTRRGSSGCKMRQPTCSPHRN